MRIAAPRWFAAVGSPLGPEALAAADALRRRYPAFTSLAIDHVVDPQGALRVLRAIDAEGRWWDVEEAAMAELWERAAARLGENALADRIVRSNAHWQARLATLPLPGRLAAEATLVEPAREAALLVAHQAALVEAAAAAEHWLQAKFELFAAGHWVLGEQSGRVWLF